MALQKCKECGREVSDKAKTCPSCGAPVKKKSGCSNFFLILVILMIIIAALSPKKTPVTPASSPLPEQAPSTAKPSEIKEIPKEEILQISSVSPEEMPKQVVLKSDQSFPTADGTGNVTVPIGGRVDVISRNDEILTLGFLGGQKELNYAETTFLDEAKVLREKNTEIAAAKKAEKLAEIEAEKARILAEEKERPKKELDRFVKLIESIDTEGVLIDSASVNEGRLKVTVKSGWHYQPYQIRLQMAQNLWKVWATIHSPSEPDRARISITDLNGNEVGGSRILAGSLIWVKE